MAIVQVAVGLGREARFDATAPFPGAQIFVDDAANEVGGAAMLGVSVPYESVSRYGVLQLDDDGHYQRIVEKPSIDEAPSNLINISKYVLPKELVEAAVNVAANPIRGEYEITDVSNNYVADGGQVKVVEARGQYLDGGSVEGLVHANNVVLADIVK